MTTTTFDCRVLEDSYKQHPAFRNGVSNDMGRLSDAVIAFDDTYKSLFGENKKRDFSKLETELCKIASCIKDQVSSSATDSLEKIFINELNSEIQKTIKLDVELAKKLSKKIRFKSKKQIDKIFNDLKQQKFFTGTISSSKVDEILSLGKNKLHEFRNNVKNGKVTREDLSFGAGYEACKITEILNGEFSNLGVIDALSRYLEYPVHVSGQAFELSVSKAQWWKNGLHGLNRPPNTLYAHLDESKANPKSIVYLSDVSENSGPTSCYPNIFEELCLNKFQEIVGRVLANIGNTPNSVLAKNYNKSYHQSMTSELFRKHFMRLPGSIRFNSHFGWDIMPDSRAERILESREKKILGPKGTFLVFDGASLLHRGGLVANGERIALQVIFALGKVPFFKNKIKKLALKFSY